MAAVHGLQVFCLGFLARPIPTRWESPRCRWVELYSSEAWKRSPQSRSACGVLSPPSWIENDSVDRRRSGRRSLKADHYISALPFERLQAIAPTLDSPSTNSNTRPSPESTLVRPPCHRPTAWHAARPHHPMVLQQGRGRYLQLVVSASRSLLDEGRQEIIDLALRELREFLPAARAAQLVKAQVIKEVRATFSARPGLEVHPAAWPRPRSPISFWREIGPAPAGRRPWRGRSAAATSQPKPLRARRVDTFCRISPENVDDQLRHCGNGFHCHFVETVPKPAY